MTINARDLPKNVREKLGVKINRGRRGRRVRHRDGEMNKLEARYAREVLSPRVSAGELSGFAFEAISLTCTDCDGGMDVHSFEHAASLGWRDIKHDDGPSWNYLGQCPDCIRAELTGDYSLFDGGSVKTIEVIQ